MLNLQTLSEKLESVGISPTPRQLAQLDSYAILLVETNRQFNLTAITDPEGVENKHMVDCAILAAQPEIAGSVVDVGAGAGFPGIVLKILRPEISLTLMEPTGKRCAFLSSALNALGLEAAVVKERAEEAARKTWRESFDVAVARAVAALPTLSEYCLPLVKPGGVFIAMKGEADAEIAAAGPALQKLGATFGETRHFTLPGGEARSLVFLNKTGITPKAYPRAGGAIAKKPL